MKDNSIRQTFVLYLDEPRNKLDRLCVIMCGYFSYVGILELQNSAERSKVGFILFIKNEDT